MQKELQDTKEVESQNIEMSAEIGTPQFGLKTSSTKKKCSFFLNEKISKLHLKHSNIIKK